MSRTRTLNVNNTKTTQWLCPHQQQLLSNFVHTLLVKSFTKLAFSDTYSWFLRVAILSKATYRSEPVSVQIDRVAS